MKSLPLVFLVAEVVFGDILHDYHQNNFAFTKQLYEKELVPVEDTFSFSPAALQAVLAIVALGGHGETQNELLKVAQLPLNTSKIAEMYLNLSEKLSVAQSSLLNFVYINTGNAVLNSSYDTLVQNVFKANIVKRPIPLSIQDVTDTIMLLSNKIVFQYRLTQAARWKTKFVKGNKSTFDITKDIAETIDVLHANEKLNYYHNKLIQAEFVEIPIIDNELTLTIVLPNEVDGLANVEKHISDVLSAQPYQKLDISVTIPAYWHPDVQDLSSFLRSLSVNISISDTAEFTAISDGPLKIHDGIQTTFVNLTKAISDDQKPSGSSVTPLPQQSEQKFLVNHPFMYYIKHSVMGVVAIGRYVKR